MNNYFADVFLNLFNWTMIAVGLLGFAAVVWESFRGYRMKRKQRRAWQRIPELGARQNVRLHKVV